MTATRRDLLVGAFAAGLGVAVASDAALADPSALLTGATSNGQVLYRLLEFEQLEAFAFAHVEQTAVLTARAKATVAHFLAQEHRHAELLGAQLAKRGVAPPTPPSAVSDVDRHLAALGVTGQLTAVHDELSAIRLLIAIETTAEVIYYRAIERLSNDAALDLAAGILGCEAQHWTGLSSVLHDGDPGIAVPHAFAPLVGQFLR
jgi:rubrerythrin